MARTAARAVVAVALLATTAAFVARPGRPSVERRRVLPRKTLSSSSGRTVSTVSPSKISKLTLHAGKNMGRRSLLQQATDFLPLLPGVWFVYLFSRLPKQYIAAKDDPNATSGTGAETWGLWTKDPGPRGVRLSNFQRLEETGQAPAGWSFDKADWWLEEHGLIMEKPDPLPPGKYEVTGDREVTTTLTIFPKDNDGKQRWELANGAKLFDVTHLPCRSARYQGSSCSPASAAASDFPVTPGAAMPKVPNCQKEDWVFDGEQRQDHAVLFVLSSQS